MRTFLNRAQAPSVRVFFILLVVGCILPIAIVAGMLIFNFYEHEQSQLIDNATSRARALTSMLDRDFANTESALLALRTSHRLAMGELETFQDRAAEALTNLRAESIVYMDADGQLLMSTSRPYGEQLPRVSETPLLARILKTGRPGVSDLYVGPILGHHIFTIAVPVLRDGAVVSILGATVAPSQLASVLGEQKLPDTWRASITDGQGNIVARNRDIASFLGRKINQELWDHVTASQEGYLRTVTLDGIAVVTVFSRSPTTHWTVAIGMPLDELTAGLRNTLKQLVAATLAALVVGIWLAWMIGERIVQSFNSLGDTASALSQGRKIVLPKLFFSEAKKLGKALLEVEASLRRTKYDAQHDALTGLANRTLFHKVVDKQIALCQRTDNHLTVLYIDLDGFKQVNDHYGHATGDELLKAVSVRLKEAIRDSDIAARLGGDEFAIALVHSNLENAKLFAARLIETISQAYQLAHVQTEISASIGLAGYPISARDIDTLLKNADEAMYIAKVSGKRRYCVAA